MLCVVVLLALLPPGTADAHATILSIAPADGTLLLSAPAELRVHFSEPISDQFISAEFTSNALDTAVLTGHLDASDPSVLVVPLPSLADGLHQIAFSVRDGEDLHEVRGRTSFSIGDHAVASPSPPPNPPPQAAETTARWLFAIGLALVVGALVTFTHRPATAARLGRRWGVLVGGAAIAILVGRIGVIAARALDLGVGLGDGLSAVARTGDMTRLPVIAAATACFVPLLAPARFPSLDAPLRTGRTLTLRVAVGWVGVVWLALVAGWGDHAALNGSVEPAVAVAKAAHLIGLGLWVGVLVVTLVTAGGRTAAALTAVSRVAVGGAVLTVATGLLLSSRLVVSLTGAFSTTFGRLLTVKLAVIAIAVLLGLAHRRRQTTVAPIVEAVLLAGAAVALGAAMATAGPAVDGAYLAAPAAPPTVPSAADADDLIIRLRAVPAQPGPNDLVVNVVQTRRPPPADVRLIEIEADTVAGTQRWTLEPDNDDSVIVNGVTLTEGTSSLHVTVRRDGLPAAAADLTIATSVPRYHHPVVVSSRRIALALRVLAVCLGVWLAWQFVRSRRRPEASATDVGSPVAHEVVEELAAGSAGRD